MCVLELETMTKTLSKKVLSKTKRKLAIINNDIVKMNRNKNFSVSPRLRVKTKQIYNETMGRRKKEVIESMKVRVIFINFYNPN
jgi:hypothetical protein